MNTLSPIGRRARRRSQRLLSALSNKEGAAAVEFAFIAFPFLFLVFALIEVTFMFFVSTTLENAAMEASRRIRTGELQLSGATGEDFRQAICDGVSVLVPCDDAVYVDVRTFNDFDSVTYNSPVTDGEFDEGSMQVDFGDAGDIVIVRVYYIWNVFTPQLGTGLANLSGGRRLIAASAAFRNEPYGDGT